MKKLFSFIAAILIFLPGYGQPYPENGMLSFHFEYSSKNQRSVLSRELMQNNENIELLLQGASKYRQQILSCKRYISIVPCIKRSDMHNAYAINRASEEASVVRAMLKIHSQIPHEFIAFAIDTTQDIENVVKVGIFSGDIPYGADSPIIHYILEGNPAPIFSRYRSGVPFGNLWMIEERGRRTIDK